ncbi:MAG TPA: PD-(D/E)XK nuclease family protein [Steroidobacteraceae bacterium]|nr:PD-(D/E)XK nuclease family protein [Steroidobacteraceae bacterium]
MRAVERGCTVLTPNSELAAALLDAIERTYRAAGRELWPTPRVREFGGWLVDRHLEELQPGVARARILSEVEERELWLQVVQSGASAELSIEPAAAARAARRARRAMVEHGIELEALRAEPTEEASALLEWSLRFDERCRALECLSADALWPSRATAPSLGPAERVAWIASPSWRPQARRWLEGAAGAPLAAAPARWTGPRPQPLRRRFGAPAEELAAIADWSERLSTGQDGARLWICIPDLAARRAAVEDAFDAVLEPERFALIRGAGRAPRYALAGGTPLALHEPVRAALELLAASHGLLEFERFSALLRAPQLTADPLDLSAARVDLELRRVAASEAPLARWIAIAEQRTRGVAVPALARLRAAHLLLGQAAGRQLLSRWVSVWVSAFEAGPWANSARWTSAEYQAAERCRELLGALAMGDALFGRMNRGEAEAVLRRAAHEVRFQTQTGIPPIWISSQLHDPYLGYGGLWVAGLDAQHWPPPPAPVPLLPVRLQRRFGIIAASAEAQLAQAQTLQERWRERGEELRFSSAATGQGQSGEVSALLAAFTATDDTASGAAPKPHWRAQQRAAPPLERLEDAQAPPFGPGERTRGVAMLRAQSRCAFQGFAFTRLLVEPLRKPIPGFNEFERGQLLHDALEHVWRVLQDSAGLAAHTADSLAPLLARAAALAIERAAARRDPGLRWREREQVRLEGLLGRWLEVERVRVPFAVERLELPAQAVRFGALELEVRIDRVDRLDDGTCVLIDYKTGAAVVDWRGERPDNPQLPIYALTLRRPLAAVAYGRINAVGCEFIAETDRPGLFKPGKRASSLEGRAHLDELIPLWEARIGRLAHELEAGRAVLDPTRGACTFCKFQALCRIDPALIESADE